MQIWIGAISAQYLLSWSLLLLHIETGFHVGLGLAWRPGSVQLPLPLELLLEVDLAILTSLLAVLLDPGRLCVEDPVTIIPNVSMVGHIGHRNYSGSCPVSPLIPERIIFFEFWINFLLVSVLLPSTVDMLLALVCC